MVQTRLLHVTVENHLAALCKHICAEQKEGRSVLVVTVHHPASVLLPLFREGGVNLARLFVVDAVGTRAGVERTHDPEHLMYLPGPTQLELIGMRTYKVIKEKAEAPPTVIVCTVNAFGLYNQPEVLEEMVRYAVYTLAGPKARIDFVLEKESPVEPSLVDFLGSIVEKSVNLAA